MFLQSNLICIWADCDACKDALVASTHGCAQHAAGLEITELPTECESDRYTHCSAEFDTICDEGI